VAPDGCTCRRERGPNIRTYTPNRHLQRRTLAACALQRVVAPASSTRAPYDLRAVRRSQDPSRFQLLNCAPYGTLSVMLGVIIRSTGDCDWFPTLGCTKLRRLALPPRLTKPGRSSSAISSRAFGDTPQRLLCCMTTSRAATATAHADQHDYRQTAHLDSRPLELESERRIVECAQYCIHSRLVTQSLGLKPLEYVCVNT
jgi:hypothetical protein